MARRPAAKSDRRPMTALMLEGGTFGANHIGANQALAEHGPHPDWVAGIAISAAVSAGNKPEDRVARPGRCLSAEHARAGGATPDGSGLALGF